MTLRYTITEFRAKLIECTRLLVGGGTVTIGPVTIVVTAEPGTPDERKEPIAP